MKHVESFSIARAPDLPKVAVPHSCRYKGREAYEKLPASYPFRLARVDVDYAIPAPLSRVLIPVRLLRY